MASKRKSSDNGSSSTNYVTLGKGGVVKSFTPPKKTTSKTTTTAPKKTTPKPTAKPVVGPTMGRSGKTAPTKTDPVRSTYGSKMEGPVSQRIRGAEWAYKSAQHKANLRAKARKNPNGRIAKALAAKAAKSMPKKSGSSRYK